MQYASDIVDKVWRVAEATGFGAHFINQQRNGIIDDHYYINKNHDPLTIDVNALTAFSTRANA